MADAVVVIPARLEATRFPRKVLASLHGRPMIAHVIAGVTTAQRVARVVVATDSDEIARTAAASGAEIVRTGPAGSGSDRVAQALPALGAADIIVNVQADEPLIEGHVIDALIERLQAEPDLDAATPARRFAADEDVADPNRVKVVVSQAGRALYFSRAPIPHGDGQALLHLGLYAWWRAALERFATRPQTPLERSERLEQLRVLETGGQIGVVTIDWRGLGVDTPEDLAAVERMLRARRT